MSFPQPFQCLRARSQLQCLFLSPRNMCPLFYSLLLPPTAHFPICQPFTPLSVLSHLPQLCFCQSYLVFPISVLLFPSSVLILHHHGTLLLQISLSSPLLPTLYGDPVLTDLLWCVKIGLLVFTWPLPEIPIVSLDQRQSHSSIPAILPMCELLWERAAGWRGRCGPILPHREEGPCCP